MARISSSVKLRKAGQGITWSSGRIAGELIQINACPHDRQKPRKGVTLR